MPDPTRFIVMHEFAAYPWNDDGQINITQWHGASNPGKMFHPSTIKGDRDKLLAPIALSWTAMPSSAISPRTSKRIRAAGSGANTGT